MIRSRSWASRDARRQPLFVGVSSPCFIALPHAQCGGIDIEQPKKIIPQKENGALHYYVDM